jgi:hypothetical protein
MDLFGEIVVMAFGDVGHRGDVGGQMWDDRVKFGGGGSEVFFEV